MELKLSTRAVLSYFRRADMKSEITALHKYHTPKTRKEKHQIVEHLKLFELFVRKMLEILDIYILVCNIKNLYTFMNSIKRCRTVR